MENEQKPDATPAPKPASAPAAPASAPAAATPAKPVELAPEGVNCPHCNERMRVYAKYASSIEYCCPSLKEDPPVLADKYAEWRDLLLKTLVKKPL
jgi:hypothetical protein